MVNTAEHTPTICRRDFQVDPQEEGLNKTNANAKITLRFLLTNVMHSKRGKKQVLVNEEVACYQHLVMAQKTAYTRHTKGKQKPMRLNQNETEGKDKLRNEAWGDRCHTRAGLDRLVSTSISLTRRIPLAVYPWAFNKSLLNS